MRAEASRAALNAAFFVSGFAALLYQVVWERLLALSLGSDVISGTLVVTAFLCGLGLGSAGGGALADRLSPRAAGRLYGLGNLAIAAFALASRPLLYDLVFLRMAPLTHSRGLGFAIALLCLLFPTVVMGASLPLLTRAVVGRVEEAARDVSRLNAWDLVGAGLGSLVCGWLLLGTFGFPRTLQIGAAISAAAGLLALAAARGRPSSRPAASDRLPEAASVSAPPTRLFLWATLFFVSGFLAVSLEIVWLRVFGVIMDGSAYVFAHVIACFLFFDGLGAWLGGRAASRVERPLELFLCLQGALVLAGATMIFALAHPMVAPLAAWSWSDRAPLTVLLVIVILPCLVVGSGAVLIGAAFPVVQRAIQGDVEGVGRRVGRVQLANVAGNALGGTATGLVFLEHLGTPGTLRLLCCVGLALTGLALASRRSRWNGRLGPAALCIAAGLVAVLAAAPGPERFWAALGASGSPLATVSVSEDATGLAVLEAEGSLAHLHANGMHQGTIPFGPVHVFLGGAGPLLHPGPERVYVIGVGSGATPHAAGADPRTRRIRAVEIMRSEMPLLRARAAHPSAPGLRALFGDPRYEIVVADARRDLASREERFHLVEADAIFPESSRSGLLYSVEFFRLVRSRLEPGGLMVQWRASERVEATFKHVFPHGLHLGAVLVGSDRPVPYDRRTIAERLDDPHRVRWLTEAGVSVQVLGQALLARTPTAWGPEAGAAMAPHLINTDLFPRDEFYLNTPR